MAEINAGAGNVQVYTSRQTSLTFRIGAETIAGRIDKIDSIKQSVMSILQTERYGSPLYSDDYGVELEQYVGKDIWFIKAGIEDTLREALTQDDRIIDVSVDSIERIKNGSCLVEFTVHTIYGDIADSLNLQ